jgi:DNA polymerase alpha subunit A
MTGARAERNEFLLLHEFHRQKYICPDKSFNTKPQAAIEALEANDEESK